MMPFGSKFNVGPANSDFLAVCCRPSTNSDFLAVCLWSVGGENVGPRYVGEAKLCDGNIYAVGPPTFDRNTYTVGRPLTSIAEIERR